MEYFAKIVNGSKFKVLSKLLKFYMFDILEGSENTSTH